MPSSLFLKKIQLINFKNYQEKYFSFGEAAQGFTGRNGVGKTNLLDAIHYLCMTKSAFHGVEQYNISEGASHFVLGGDFLRKGELLQVGCRYEKGKRKIFKLNQKAYPKISQHLGVCPCVLFSPQDSNLIYEGNETRRRFFDKLICQTNPAYLRQLLDYKKTLQQRNFLLKQFQGSTSATDLALLHPYDHRLIAHSKHIAKERTHYAEALCPLFESFYQILSGAREAVRIGYQTKVTADFETTFSEARPQDIALQRTTQGIHHDRYIFYMDEKPLKRFASQGQQKSFLVALKLAKARLIGKHTQIYPILLLDDIFDKLDEERIGRLLKLIKTESRSHIFFTDAHPEQSKKRLQTAEIAHTITRLLG